MGEILAAILALIVACLTGALIGLVCYETLTAAITTLRAERAARVASFGIFGLFILMGTGPMFSLLA